MVAISCENLSKKFVIRHQGTANYTALRDVITESITGLWRKKTVETREEFFALRDVSFEIKQGDRVGIIGRNGAGKSTLLKVLSRITEPTSGSLKIKGRVASLLEVGTGFHPELTGRENIYLNGSILGMSRVEIKRKFDEIVDFSEVEKFLDTPVKRYSSGMYVRLAFAVAAHLEPEILVVDEVLAVGDAQFQEKCLGKMRDVSGQGRTVLFVSHNMASIEQLCNEAMWLHHGQLVKKGQTTEVITHYLRAKNNEASQSVLLERKDRNGNGKVKFMNVSFLDADGHVVSEMKSGASYYISIKMKKYDAMGNENFTVAFGIDNSRAVRIAFMSSDLTGDRAITNVEADYLESRIFIPKLPLKAGLYTYSLFVRDNLDTLDWIQNAGSFTVEPGNFYNTGKSLPDGQGDVLLDYRFK